ncbi:MAG: glycine--tRNA ligase [Candidatus Marsarchaeota archaeon]|nr:glycine--tRNA ligase [Candidatus Marsarchaeota archaeon]
MPESKKENKAYSIIERRGIFYPAFDLYNASSGFYDYGAIGLRILRGIEGAWRNIFVNGIGATEIQTTDIVPEIVLKASGHVSTFTDPVIDCKTCKSSFRADKLLEEHYEKKHDAAGLAALKKFDKKDMQAKIDEYKIRCQRCGGELHGIEDVNLMFRTHLGHGPDNVAYLRPETAQGIFVDFKNIFRIYGLRLPTAIAQSGKAYRNEISPRQQLVRMREFHQMETEIFFDPGAEQKRFNAVDLDALLSEEISFVYRGGRESRETLRALLKNGQIPNKLFAMCVYMEARLLDTIGIPKNLYRFREVEREELPHYSKGNVDLEISTSYGWIEVSGNAYRADWDLSQHAKQSGKEIAVLGDGKKITPHVVEASIGLDRLFISLLDTAAQEGRDRGWEWLRLSESVAPYKYAVLPLQKDAKLEDMAARLQAGLSERGVASYYSASGSIGKRYAKSDEIGVPYAITVDFQSLDDGTVTVRDRDTAKQVRKKAGDIK